MTDHFINQFKSRYENITAGDSIEIRKLYTEDVIVVDPLKTIEGIDFYEAYLNQTLNRLNQFKIQFIDEIIQDNPGYTHAFLTWRLRINDESLNEGKPQSLEGATFIKIRDQVFFQQNYYDLGTIYEKTPLLGYLVRKYKARISEFNF